MAGWTRGVGEQVARWARVPQPFVGLALAAGAGILLGEGGAAWFGHGAPGVWPAGPWIACGMFFAGASVFSRARRRPVCWALVVCGFAALHLFRLNDPASVGLAAELAAGASASASTPGGSTPAPGAGAATGPGAGVAAATSGEILRGRGVILDEPRCYKPNGGSAREVSGPTWRFTVGLSSLALRGREWDCHARVAVLWRNGSANLAMGEEVELTGRGGGIAVPRNPGEFDQEGYRRRHGVRTELRCSGAAEVRRIAPAGWARAAAALPGLAHRFERWTQERLTLGLQDDPEASAVISTLLLGLRSDPGLGDLEPAFQRTGTLHFFAIDGLKLGLLSVLLARALTFSGMGRRWVRTLVLPLLVFYALATGLSSASTRAVLVALLLVAGEWIDRPSRTLNSLGAAAVVILALDTNQLFDLGFQLTFFVMLSILLLGMPLREALSGLGAPDPFLPSTLYPASRRGFEILRHRTIDLACISCAAGLGSLPLMLIYFHVVSPISLAANVVVFPVAFAVVAVGVLSLAVSLVTSVVSLISQAAAAALFQTWVVWINNANWLLAKTLLATVRLFDAAPGGSFYAALPDWRWERPAAEVTVLDLPSGARSGFLRVRGGGDWLIDTGRPPDFRRIVVPFLHACGLGRIDGLILSQGDSYHLAAASLVLTDLQPARMFDAGLSRRSAYLRQFQTLLEERRRSLTHWRAGNALPFAGGTELRVLYPPENPPGRTAADRAMVLQLRAAGWRVLFLGDSGAVARQWLLTNAAPEALRSDVVITGAAPERFGETPGFLESVGARLVVREASQRFGGGGETSERAGTTAVAVQTAARTMTAAKSGAMTLRIYPARIEAAGFVDGAVTIQR